MCDYCIVINNILENYCCNICTILTSDICCIVLVYGNDGGDLSRRRRRCF